MNQDFPREGRRGVNGNILHFANSKLQVRTPSAAQSLKRCGAAKSPPNHSNDLLKWGGSGDQQIARAISAVSKLGVFWDGAPLTYI